MLIRSGLMSLMLVVAVAAPAQAEDVVTADSFVDDVWLYFEDRCETAALENEALKIRLGRRLTLSFNRIEEGALSALDEALLDGSESLSSDLVVRSVAVGLLGAMALDEQVAFWQFVGAPAIASNSVTEDYLVSPEYAAEFAERRVQAESSLAMMDCLLPTADEVRAAKEQLDADNVEAELWFKVSEAAYSEECEHALRLMAERMLNVDFDPDTISEVFMSTMNEHQLYLNINPASERCEDFS